MVQPRGPYHAGLVSHAGSYTFISTVCSLLGLPASLTPDLRVTPQGCLEWIRRAQFPSCTCDSPLPSATALVTPTGHLTQLGGSGALFWRLQIAGLRHRS